MLAKIVALVAHEILAPVLAEYRKLDAGPAEPAGQPQGELSCTSASTERAWAPAAEAPAAAFGFALPAPPPAPADRPGHASPATPPGPGTR